MGNLRLYGSTSGYVEIAPPAVGGSQVLTLPTDSVQPGMVLVASQSFSAVSSVSLNNVFSSTYANYTAYITLDSTTINASSQIRMRSAGTDDTSAVYRYAGFYTSWGTVLTGDGATGQTYMNMGGNDGQVDMSLGIFDPNRAQRTFFCCFNAGNTYSSHAMGRLDTSTQYDGISLIRNSGTMTGTIRIYGLRNS